VFLHLPGGGHRDWKVRRENDVNEFVHFDKLIPFKSPRIISLSLSCANFKIRAIS